MFPTKWYALLLTRVKASHDAIKFPSSIDDRRFMRVGTYDHPDEPGGPYELMCILQCLTPFDQGAFRIRYIYIRADGTRVETLLDCNRVILDHRYIIRDQERLTLQICSDWSFKCGPTPYLRTQKFADKFRTAYELLDGVSEVDIPL